MDNERFIDRFVGSNLKQDAKLETYEFRGMIAVKFPSGRTNLHILLPDPNGWGNRIGAFQGRFNSLESAQTFAAEN